MMSWKKLRRIWKAGSSEIRKSFWKSRSGKRVRKDDFSHSHTASAGCWICAHSCGLILCSCDFVVCFADESMRTKPRNHTNQESRKDTRIQLFHKIIGTNFTWLKPGENERSASRLNRK